MPKALDTHVLDIAIQSEKNWEEFYAGPFIFHWQSPMTREREKLFVDDLDSLTWTVI